MFQSRSNHEYSTYSFFHLEGYELFIDHKNSTCTKRNNQIYGHYLDESACKTRCDSMEYCGFFFVNTGGWCALYNSCNEKRAVKNTGTTFMKSRGTKLYNKFVSRKILFQNIVQHFS